MNPKVFFSMNRQWAKNSVECAALEHPLCGQAALSPPPSRAGQPTLFAGTEGRAPMSFGRKEVDTVFWSQAMNALSMLRDWRGQVQDQLLPELHGHQSKALADLSFAMTLAPHCHSGKLAVNVPGQAKPASVKRRVERFLADDRVNPEEVWPQDGFAGSSPDGFADGFAGRTALRGRVRLTVFPVPKPLTGLDPAKRLWVPSHTRRAVRRRSSRLQHCSYSVGTSLLSSYQARRSYAMWAESLQIRPGDEMLVLCTSHGPLHEM